ncbi:C40 family peptidase [Bordetella hinzii]|uniref:C40 family peptidase n=1 Tax=Bordetella hinzii TaxID=103855 RepID=UPI00045B49AE|nr:C40 family peptidase [Bordetella hinzii]KCB48552.1 NlpC/P60 family protein [Bordetella hinzii 4161]QDJ37929.1 hydrolase Nlp/P60 [Bordetella hinzii]VEH25048.1 NlpC/P60 family [Bordetella hinzii]
MLKRTVKAIAAQAVAEYPREACGLIVMVGRLERYVPCRNTAHGIDHFSMAPQDYAAAEEMGRIVAVVHSHPDASATPSAADRVACEASGLPWFIVAVRKDEDGKVVAGEVRGFRPEGYRAPLLGRPFEHGVLDCYSIIRDWYARERDIPLPDFERQDGWWKGEQELYLAHFSEAGFRALDDGEPLATGDVILMQHHSERTNHGGVFLGSEGLAEAPCLHPLPDAMLHHLYGRPSERVVYGGYWREITRLRLRYQSDEPSGLRAHSFLEAEQCKS